MNEKVQSLITQLTDAGLSKEQMGRFINDLEEQLYDEMAENVFLALPSEKRTELEDKKPEEMSRKDFLSLLDLSEEDIDMRLTELLDAYLKDFSEKLPEIKTKYATDPVEQV